MYLHNLAVVGEHKHIALRNPSKQGPQIHFVQETRTLLKYHTILIQWRYQQIKENTAPNIYPLFDHKAGEISKTQ